MSSSPICGTFEHPLESPGSVQGHTNFSFTTSSTVIGESLQLTSVTQVGPDCDESLQPSRERDYFGMTFPLQVLQMKHNSTLLSPRNPSLHDEASSISSLASVSTAVFSHQGPFVVPDFSHSKDTLVNEKIDERNKVMGSTRNMLLLSLNMPRRGTRAEIVRSATAQKSEQELISSRVDKKVPHSATTTHFELGHKSPLIIEDVNIMTSPYDRRPGSILFLRKQVTAPSFLSIHETSFLSSIKAEQAKRCLYMPPQTSFRDSIMALSPRILYKKTREVANLISNASINDETNMKNVLAIDIRPLTDYVKGHLAGAINVCLPLTLLKRQNFNLKKCINSLPAYENLVLQNYLRYNKFNQAKGVEKSDTLSGKFGLPTLIVYDNAKDSANLLFMCKKLIDCSCWDAAAAPSIILIDDSFESLAQSYPSTLVSGKVDMIDLDQLPFCSGEQTNAETLCSLPAGSVRAAQAVSPHVVPGVATLSLLVTLSSTAVSNFFLPQDLPCKPFHIRHNEEIFNTSMTPCAEDELSAITVKESELKYLPAWLALSILDKAKVRADFNKLEKREKDRLNFAFSSRAGEVMGTGEVVPSISTGLDYGHKNRYKDIFLFEHSRVKLLDRLGACATDPDLDYINASYLRSNESPDVFRAHNVLHELSFVENNYIATQGPLSQTVGDFWRCVVDQKSIVIVSLLAEFENGVEKCFPYWREGIYASGSHEVRVVLEQSQTVGPILERAFRISIDQGDLHHVTQLHLETWRDMSVDVEIDDIVMMVAMKKRVLAAAKSPPAIPAIVLCSAGCGRTGVFCVVDQLINCFESSGGCELARDPIFEVVDAYRRQRVLMVQTVRQYGFLYRIMVRYLVRQMSCERYLEIRS